MKCKATTRLWLIALAAMALLAGPGWAVTFGEVANTGKTAVNVAKGSAATEFYSVVVSNDTDALLMEGTDYLMEWFETQASTLAGVSFDDHNGKITVAAEAEAGATTIKFWALVTDALDPTNMTGSPEFSVTVKVLSLDISSSDATVEAGKTVTLTAATTPAGEPVSWKTASADIATVADGVVTGVASGDVVITAFLTSLDSVSADCKVKVTPAAAKTVAVSPTAVSVDLGKTVTLTATTTPASEDVVWTTSDAAVASVDQNGKVTGMALGDAVVRAALSSDKSISADCKVKVISTVPSTTLSLTSKDATVEVGRTVTLIAAVSPATTPLYWISDSNDIATVSQAGVVLGVRAGKTTIRVTTGSLSDDCAVTVTDAEAPVGPTDGGSGGGGCSSAGFGALALLALAGLTLRKKQ